MTALDEAGRLEAIWFAFTEVPWLKVWSVAPTRPLTSHRVTSPYNYPFSRPPGPRSPSPYAARRGRRPPPRS